MPSACLQHQYSTASAELVETFVHPDMFDNRTWSAVTKLYKLCPCCAGYVHNCHKRCDTRPHARVTIVTNAVTPVGNELDRSFLC